MRKILFGLFLAGMMFSACGVKQEKEAENPFVTRMCSSLVLNGEEYRYIGTNFWFGAILGSEGQGGDRQRLCRELDKLHALGLDNLRILVGSDGERGVAVKAEPTLQMAPGVYNDTILAGLDYLLQQMDERGMKAVLYLNNSWEWSGGYGFYLEQAGCGPVPLPQEAGYHAYIDYAAQFSGNAEAQALFYDYVRFILGRTNRYTNRAYVDDPTIMSWQIGNEPRAFSDEMKQPFAKWIGETAALIRSIDKNHLISIGSEGVYGCEVDTALYEQICADPNIDYMNVHVWPYNWQWVRQDSLLADVETACQNTHDYVRLHTNIALSLQKPLVIEEFGFPRDGFVFTPGSPTEGRDRYFDFMLSLVQSEPTVCGCNFWGWGGEARPSHERWQVGDPYTADPPQEQQGLNAVFDCDTTTLNIIKKHTQK